MLLFYDINGFIWKKLPTALKTKKIIANVIAIISNFGQTHERGSNTRRLVKSLRSAS